VNVDLVLAEHGDAMRRLAPTIYKLKVREGALSYFLAGKRAAGLAYARRYARLDRWSPKLYAIVVLGMIYGPLLAVLQVLQARAREHFRMRASA